MKPLRIILIVLGCSLIILNMWRMADTEAIDNRTPDVMQLVGLYISKLYLMMAGIICLALSNSFHSKGSKVAKT
ncbi:MAG TPA: hypothetical protein VGD33_12580 [Chitinophagaceae bacterium]